MSYREALSRHRTLAEEGRKQDIQEQEQKGNTENIRGPAQVNNHKQSHDWKGLTFKPSEEEVEWLDDCMVGFLKEKFT